MKLIKRLSPNFDERKFEVDMLLLHYTGMPSGEEALAHMCNPAAKVAAHYCVEEDGRIFWLVGEDKRAWHAGASCWSGEADTNSRSIGVEVVNPGHEFGYRAFPKAQIGAVIRLCREILGDHGIPPTHVLGHSDVAPGRKEDPGELFPWKDLAAKGIGLWPETAVEAKPLDSTDKLAAALAQFGYDVKGNNLSKVITAFQRHFMPECIGTDRGGGGGRAGAGFAGSVEREVEIIRWSFRDLIHYCPV